MSEFLKVLNFKYEHVLAYIAVIWVFKNVSHNLTESIVILFLPLFKSAVIWKKNYSSDFVESIVNAKKLPLIESAVTWPTLVYAFKDTVHVWENKIIRHGNKYEV